MSQRSRRRRRRLQESGRKKLLLGLGIPMSVVAIGLLAGALWLVNTYNSAPSLATLRPITKGTVSKVYAADGSLIGVIHSEPTRPPPPSRGDPPPHQTPSRSAPTRSRRT